MFGVWLAQLCFESGVLNWDLLKKRRGEGGVKRTLGIGGATYTAANFSLGVVVALAAMKASKSSGKILTEVAVGRNALKRRSRIILSSVTSETPNIRAASRFLNAGRGKTARGCFMLPNNTNRRRSFFEHPSSRFGRFSEASHGLTGPIWTPVTA
jgi:hypothetical protein